MSFLIKDKHSTIPIILGLDVCIVGAPATLALHKKGDKWQGKTALKTQTHVAKTTTPSLTLT